MDPNRKYGSLPLASWDKIYKPKCEDGLEIRRFQEVNAVNLTKLEWKILKDPNNLWAKVVSTKYLTRKSFIEVRKTCKALRM